MIGNQEFPRHCHCAGRDVSRSFARAPREPLVGSRTARMENQAQKQVIFHLRFVELEKLRRSMGAAVSYLSSYLTALRINPGPLADPRLYKQR